jgi:hypothetical protein
MGKEKPARRREPKGSQPARRICSSARTKQKGKNSKFRTLAVFNNNITFADKDTMK